MHSRMGYLPSRYLDCSASKTVTIKVDCSQADHDPVTVSEAVNVYDVAETCKTAATIWGDERKVLIEECQKRLTESPSVDTEKVQLLLTMLRGQLEQGDLCAPSLMRQSSNNTRNFRGGGYVSKGVADFSQESYRHVSASIGAPPPLTLPNIGGGMWEIVSWSYRWGGASSAATPDSKDGGGVQTLRVAVPPIVESPKQGDDIV